MKDFKVVRDFQIPAFGVVVAEVSGQFVMAEQVEGGIRQMGDALSSQVAAELFVAQWILRRVEERQGDFVLVARVLFNQLGSSRLLRVLDQVVALGLSATVLWRLVMREFCVLTGKVEGAQSHLEIAVQHGWVEPTEPESCQSVSRNSWVFDNLRDDGELVYVFRNAEGLTCEEDRLRGVFVVTDLAGRVVEQGVIA